jgi:hypothetical protein
MYIWQNENINVQNAEHYLNLGLGSINVNYYYIKFLSAPVARIQTEAIPDPQDPQLSWTILSPKVKKNRSYKGQIQNSF